MTLPAPRSVRVWKYTCGSLLLLFCVAVLRSAWVSEDAYITFRTVQNLFEGHGLRWNVSERTQTYTHPLWMFVIAGCRALSGEYFFSVIAISILFSLGAVGVLLTRVATSVPAAVLAGLALITSKSFVDYSTSGLESPLLHKRIEGLELQPKEVEGYIDGAILLVGLELAPSTYVQPPPPGGDNLFRFILVHPIEHRFLEQRAKVLLTQARQ